MYKRKKRITKTQRNWVADNLLKTVEFMQQLKPSQFNYQQWVTKGESGCGTVCCIAGWYPKYRPDSGLVWSSFYGNVILVKGKDKGANIATSLKLYHKISIDLVKFLFMGHNNDLKQIIPLSTGLKKVTLVWLNIIEMIRLGMLDHELLPWD